MKMNTALHNVSFVWNFIFYSSFKHFPYKTEDYAQSNSALESPFHVKTKDTKLLRPP